jgi:2-haloalkanoic acid dehalogenase type II
MMMRYEYLTFDCYGTLVDWRNGILSAFTAAAEPDAEPLEPDRVLALHAHHEAEVQAGSYRLYRAVLTETARRVAADRGLEGAFGPVDCLAESLPRWRVFPEVDAVLSELRRQGIRLGILSNIDDDLLAATLKQFEVRFDLLITAEQVRSYKPATAHFERAREQIGERRWLHVAQSQFHDVAAARRLGIPAAWINRLDESPVAGLRPVATFPDLTGLGRWLA